MTSMHTQQAIEPQLARPRRFGDTRDWFYEPRFGLFIHWGLYAISAWHEQELYRKKLAPEEYFPLMRKFNPSRYSPAAWLDLAQEAGMEYICFTAKHCDGFCLWDSRYTECKVTNPPRATVQPMSRPAIQTNCRQNAG